MELLKIGRINGNNSFEIDKEYKDALMGIDEFSHLIVVWWADHVDNPDLRKIMSSEKPYKNGPDSIGILATRSPLRPNPICISIIDVKSIDFDLGIIYTSYIDAENGTPILDIKPYYPCTDLVKEYKLPKWCDGLPNCIEDSADYDWSNFFNF
ncbi:UNVERIFIED_CONTAM: tRNA-Thr(GGU) m(6)t(6)A37 methyltransferase TsaA [Acetivibrio alkalicellulosi]